MAILSVIGALILTVSLPFAKPATASSVEVFKAKALELTKSGKLRKDTENPYEFAVSKFYSTDNPTYGPHNKPITRVSWTINSINERPRLIVTMEEKDTISQSIMVDWDVDGKVDESNTEVDCQNNPAKCSSGQYWLDRLNDEILK
jgi:hypothetical protein